MFGGQRARALVTTADDWGPSEASSGVWAMHQWSLPDYMVSEKEDGVEPARGVDNLAFSRQFSEDAESVGASSITVGSWAVYNVWIFVRLTSST